MLGDEGWTPRLQDRQGLEVQFRGRVVNAMHILEVEFGLDGIKGLHYLESGHGTDTQSARCPHVSTRHPYVGVEIDAFLLIVVLLLECHPRHVQIHLYIRIHCIPNHIITTPPPKEMYVFRWSPFKQSYSLGRQQVHHIVSAAAVQGEVNRVTIYLCRQPERWNEFNAGVALQLVKGTVNDVEGRIWVQVEVRVVLERKVVPYFDIFLSLPSNLLVILLSTLLPFLLLCCFIFSGLILLALLTTIIVSFSYSLHTTH